ncbi:alanine racemase [uncultured Sphingomonas sp.]|uniref:alanine racemase n=1 Tax=uncultured Sphingomonas sp. TaxID=158754 RepID=UPI0025D96ABE|nr:alanine racemase [uncultured Sphingomonas sp.]
MRFSRPLRLDLNSDSLVANWRMLAAQGGTAACGAAIKADGYGLGARGVAVRLAKAGCRDLFVSNWAEAEALGALPEGVALSVLHGVRAEDMALARTLPARPVLNSAAQVARWRDAGGGRCDVMVDTGMSRLGLDPREACSGLLDGLDIDTLLSHLACAEERDHPLNAMQLARFVAVRAKVPARRYSLANSAGILLGRDYAFDLTRPGLALYGGIPDPNDAEQRAALQQVARLMAQVLQIRNVPTGESVGYGATWVAARPSTVAILNIGYADGLFRRLAPLLSVSCEGAPCPVIGRISMDLTAVDVTGAGVTEGDWLELDFALPDLAAGSGLSQYELLTSLGQRFDRRWRD